MRGQILCRVKTGLNEASVVDRATRNRLIAEDPKSAEVIKPLLVGDDVRRYEVHFREQYLVFTRHGVSIAQYPAVLNHLRAWRKALEPRPSTWNGERDGTWPGRKPGAYKWYEMQDTVDYYAAFEKPEIVYPDMRAEAGFVLDAAGHYSLNTTYFIARGDWFLLGALNSQAAFDYAKSTCAVLGDEDERGLLRFSGDYMETLPIPDAPKAERDAAAKLARRAQELHGQRRKRVEKFLRDIGSSQAESSSGNRLEFPWDTKKCTDAYFRKKAKGYPLWLLSDVCDETTAMTEETLEVEDEMDERVKALYGL